MTAEIASLQREIDGSSARPAPAFGPWAFYLDIAGAGMQLHILHGRDYFLISVLGLGEGSPIGNIVDRLGRRALSRL